MRNAARYLHALTMAAVFIAIPALCTPFSDAQTEVQIMVNGSWDFVKDPSPQKDPNSAGEKLDRVVLVAAYIKSHGAFIFQGSDAAHFLTDTLPPNPIYSPLATGIYYLDINNLIQHSGHTRPVGDLPPVIWSDTEAQSVPTKTIENILYNSSSNVRWAVSLPAPDYYSTYSGPRGTSESAVDVKVIPDSATATKLAKSYTTWMVLHYWVNSSAPVATLIGNLDNTTTPLPLPNLNFTTTSASPVPGVSVVMGAIEQECDFKCDLISQHSFDQGTSLWGFTRYAKFPEEDNQGTQTKGKYNNCPSPPHRCPKSGGSADCHSPQMSINNIIENSVP